MHKSVAYEVYSMGSPEHALLEKVLKNVQVKEGKKKGKKKQVRKRK